jgi:hypothetical protein
MRNPLENMTPLVRQARAKETYRVNGDPPSLGRIDLRREGL